MKIVVICEGKTERSLRHGLREFVRRSARGEKGVGIKLEKLDGPTIRKKLARVVERSLEAPGVLGVIALTDMPKGITSAADAKNALYRLAAQSKDEQRFRAHVAKFELEAWMMPFWDDIAKSLGIRAKKPGANPEDINGERPPSAHLSDLYRRAKSKYQKVLHASKWLTAENIEKAAKQCPELELFLNSLKDLASANQPN